MFSFSTYIIPPSTCTMYITCMGTWINNFNTLAVRALAEERELVEECISWLIGRISV